MKFTSTVELGGKTATGLEVPAADVAELGSGKRPAVTVTINGYTYRSTIASMGGRYMLPLSADNREGAGVQAGDTVEVDIELDTAPRVVEIPEDFEAALTADPNARAQFDTLSHSNKRRLVLAIDGAKAAETRRRRIEQTVEKLADGRV